MKTFLTAFGITGSLAGGLAAAGVWQAYRYTHPPRARAALHPRDLGIPHEEVEIPSGELRLASWYLPAESGRAIVLLHGTPLEKSILLRFGRNLQRHGFNVLLPDFRAHGATAGGARTFGYREADDVLAAVAWLRARGDLDPAAIGVMGFSMGAVAALLAAARDPGIAAVAADSPFADFSEVVARRTRGQLLARLMMPAVTRLGSRLTGVPLAHIAPRHAVTAIGPRPVFLIHGDADGLMPVEHSIELFERLTGPKELWIVEGAAHVESSTIAPDEYLERVVRFFDRYLVPMAEDRGPE